MDDGKAQSPTASDSSPSGRVGVPSPSACETCSDQIAELCAAHGPIVSACRFASGAIFGDWRLTAFIGRGGNGEVYCAEHIALGTSAAVKVLVRDEPRAKERFTREATVASDIHALGVLADACFCGNPPRTWARIIRRATSSIPAHRYPSVAAFARAIRWRHLWRNATWPTVALLVLAAMAKLNSGKSHIDDASGARGSMMGNITPEVLEGVMRTGRIPSQKATAEPSIMPTGAYNHVRFGGPETVKELMEQINEERSIEIQSMEP